MAAALSSSVSSLQSSLELLESSTDILDAGVNDFPRLCKVLQTTRHFELLPEPTLHEAQKSLLDEISPSITHLLTVASNHVDRLKRREEALKAKSLLQEGRLGHDTRQPPAPRETKTNDTQKQERLAAELHKLTQKKERLQYTVNRLELQSKQRERQLRKTRGIPPIIRTDIEQPGATPRLRDGQVYVSAKTKFDLFAKGQAASVEEKPQRLGMLVVNKSEIQKS